jgi:hypothetical protein
VLASRRNHFIEVEALVSSLLDHKHHHGSCHYAAHVQLVANGTHCTATTTVLRIIFTRFVQQHQDLLVVEVQSQNMRHLQLSPATLIDHEINTARQNRHMEA